MGKRVPTNAVDVARVVKAHSSGSVKYGVTTTSDYVCPSCGGLVGSHEVHSCINPPWGKSSTWPVTIDTTYVPTKTGVVTAAIQKDIRWQKYTPADAPPDGDYIVALVNKKNGKKETYFSSFTRSRYRWNDVEDIDIDLVVTHYARIELP